MASGPWRHVGTLRRRQGPTAGPKVLQSTGLSPWTSPRGAGNEKMLARISASAQAPALVTFGEDITGGSPAVGNRSGHGAQSPRHGSLLDQLRDKREGNGNANAEWLKG